MPIPVKANAGDVPHDASLKVTVAAAGDEQKEIDFLSWLIAEAAQVEADKKTEAA